MPPRVVAGRRRGLIMNHHSRDRELKAGSPLRFINPAVTLPGVDRDGVTVDLFFFFSVLLFDLVLRIETKIQKEARQLRLARCFVRGLLLREHVMGWPIYTGLLADSPCGSATRTDSSPTPSCAGSAQRKIYVVD